MSDETRTPTPADEPERVVRSAADPAQFSPSDLSDGRTELQWRSNYPGDAGRQIAVEASYLAVLLVAFMTALLWLYFSDVTFLTSEMSQDLKHFGLAWLSGTVGGIVLGVKWLYHIVPKKLWHQDRVLWRIFTPHVSGALPFFLYALASSGLIQIFNAQALQSPKAIVGLSFMIGYFSDSALAKLRELADTLFGATARDHVHKSPPHEEAGKQGSR